MISTTENHSEQSARKAPFPYPLSPENDESGLLVDWIRNHSSYLTVGNLAAKLGRVAAFVGGTIGNWLFLVPWMLGAALVIGYLHFYFLDHWFRSWFALSVFIWWPVGKAFRMKERRAESERDAGRKRWNPTWTPTRRGGSLLLSAVIAAGIVLVPHVVEILRDIERDLTTGPVQATAVLAAAIAALRFAQGFVAGRSRLLLIVLQVATAALGLLFLVGILTWLENYVVYGNPYFFLSHASWRWASLLNLSFVLPVAVVAMIGIFLWAGYKDYQIFQRSPPFLFWTVRYPLLTLIGAILVWLGLWFASSVWVPWEPQTADTKLTESREQIGNLTRPISRMVASLDQAGAIPSPSKLDLQSDRWRGTRSKTYKDEFGFSERMLEILQVLASQRVAMAGYYNAKPHGYDQLDAASKNRSEWSVEYFGAAQEFIDTVGELGDLSPFELAHLRSVVSEVYRKEFTQRSGQSAEENATWKADLNNAAITEAAYQEAKQTIAGLVKQDQTLTTEVARTYLADDFVKKVSKKLKQRKINAYHQREFADLVGRTNDKLKGVSRTGSTVASPGVVKLFAPKSKGNHPRRSIARGVLDAVLPKTKVKTLDDPKIAEWLSKWKLDKEIAQRRHKLQDMATDELVSRTEIDFKSKTAETRRQADVAIEILVRRALDEKVDQERKTILMQLGKLARPPVAQGDGESVKRYQAASAGTWPDDAYTGGIMARFGFPPNYTSGIAAADDVVVAMRQGGQPLSQLTSVRGDLMRVVYWSKFHLFLAIGLLAVL